MKGETTEKNEEESGKERKTERKNEKTRHFVLLQNVLQFQNFALGQIKRLIEIRHQGCESFSGTWENICTYKPWHEAWHEVLKYKNVFSPHGIRRL